MDGKHEHIPRAGPCEQGAGGFHFLQDGDQIVRFHSALGQFRFKNRWDFPGLPAAQIAVQILEHHVVGPGGGGDSGEGPDIFVFAVAGLTEQQAQAALVL